MTQRFRSNKSKLLWLLPLGFLAVFYFFPLSQIFGVSFARSEDAGGALPFLDALTSGSVRSVLWFTIWQAGLSTLLTILIGLPGAYLLARYDFRGKSLFRALTGIPFVMPTLVVAAGFNALLGPQGWVNALLIETFDLSAPPIQFINTFGAILTAHVFYNLTIVLRLVGDFWARLDTRLGQAAKTLGANRWEVFRRITLPLLAPAITAAALLIFIFDFSSFAVVLVLGGPKFATLEVEIYYQTISLFNLPVAAALSILQLTTTLILTVVYTRLSNRISRPLSGQSIAAPPPIRGMKKRLAASLIIGGLLLITASPLFALAARSITHLGPERTRDGPISQGLTLDFYRALSDSPTNSVVSFPPLRAIGVSLGYGAGTVVLALLLGLPAAWALAWSGKSRFNQFIDPILMLPLGTSAVTLGLGFLVALNRPPLDLRASPLLIPIAHTLVAFPFVVRSLTPALRSIQPRIRQAAGILGASPTEVIRYIDAPLVGRALLVAATFAFTISIGEFGATALIARPEFPTVPMAIFRFLSRPGALNYGQALALSTILMVVTGAGMLAIERVRLGKGEF